MSLDHAFFYKSINGDRVYDDTSFEHWLKKFFTSGVFLNDLQVVSNDDMTVSVNGGYVNIDGKVKIFENATPLIIETAGASYPRIDSIVLERNDTERDILLKVVKGGYSSEPVAHTPVRQDGIYQLVIAQVLVNAGAVKVIQANITDTRSNTELCGIVAGAVDQIDFSQVQAQFDSYFAQYKKQIATDYAQYNDSMEEYLDQMEADFSAWFEEIRNQLDEDAAGHLQNQIDEINEKLEYAGGSMVEITVDAGEHNAEGLEVNLVIGGKTYTETINGNTAKFTGILEVGTAKITCIDEAQEIDVSKSIDIPYYGAYETSITLKSDGSYKEWIEAGGLNPSAYENLEALLEDEKAVRTLMTKKDAVDVLAQIKVEDLATIINHPYAAKWINYREYAYSTLSAVPEIKNLMDEAGMYGMYIAMKEPRALVPTLASNNGSDGGECIASSHYQNFLPHNVFDGNISTGWLPKIGETKVHLDYRFNVPTIVKKISININRANSPSDITIKFRGSNNGEDWVVLDEFTSIVGETERKIENNTTYLYYGIYSDGKFFPEGGYYWEIRTLQFYGYQEGETLWQPKGLVPVMTSNTAPYGEAFASDEFSAGCKAFNAFDQISTSAWFSNQDQNATKIHVGYKFTNPTIVKKVYACFGEDILSQTFCVEAYNGTTWEKVSDDITSTDTEQNIFLDCEKAYMQYRLYFYNQKTKGAGLKCGVVFALQFYGRQLEALIPPMTSNTTPIGEALAHSSIYNECPAYYAFDDGVYTAICTGGVGSWVGYKFDKPIVAQYLKFSTIRSSGGTRVLEYRLEASSNGNEWNPITDVLTIPQGTSSTDVLITSYSSVANTEAYTHYRVCAIKLGDSNSPSMANIEFQLYGTPDYESRTYIYEHGVEVMEIKKQNGGSGVVSSDNDALYGAVGPSLGTYAFTTKNSVDFSDKSVMACVVGDKAYVAKATQSMGTFGVKSTNNYEVNDSTLIAETRFGIGVINTIPTYLELSSISGSNYPIFADATSDSNRHSTIAEWWLE